jgi:hypothetical protein
MVFIGTVYMWTEWKSSFKFRVNVVLTSGFFMLKTLWISTVDNVDKYRF